MTLKTMDFSHHDEVTKAVQAACYSGERILFEEGELKAAVVPIEDLEVLEEIEKSGL